MIEKTFQLVQHRCYKCGQRREVTVIEDGKDTPILCPRGCGYTAKPVRVVMPNIVVPVQSFVRF